jgi:hypothetical protein
MRRKGFGSQCFWGQLEFGDTNSDIGSGGAVSLRGGALFILEFTRHSSKRETTDNRIPVLLREMPAIYKSNRLDTKFPLAFPTERTPI